MPRTIVLDTFAVGSMGQGMNARSSPTTLCRDWARACIAAGNRVLVPAVCYYEALREAERRKAHAQVMRVRQFCFEPTDRFLPLETADLELAARMWGQIRNMGLPTAGPDALDVDVLLAAQCLALGLPATDCVVATTNVGHLTRFVPDEQWQTIAPGS